MYTVYAIKSLHRKYIYVGLTSDLQQRFIRHNKGYERSTRPYKPYRIIYYKVFCKRVKAREHEKYLKSGIGKEYLRTK